MTSLERLEKLRALRDPEYAIKLELLKIAREREKLQGEPGVPGRTPIKGIDYFTQDEIAAIIQAVAAISIRHGKDGKDGFTPKKGIDYHDGETPVRGVHYWTPQDIAHIVSETAKHIPKQKAVTAKDVMAEIKKNPFTMKDLGDYEDIKDLPDLIKFLKRGGFRGGGGTSTASTGAIVYYVPTGLVNGVNTTFTPTAAPTSVIADGATYFDGAGYTFTTPNIVMDIPPSQYIKYSL